MIKNINWYPGHMKKTRELIADNLKAVDVCIEIIDARIPISSRNPIIEELVTGKERVIVLNKIDLADPLESKKWEDKLKTTNIHVISINANTGDGIKKLFDELESIDKNRPDTNRNIHPMRIMVVGIPNVGKSSLINRLTGKKSTKVGNRPGVTKGKQWLTLKNKMQLLDTPGILWPKFEDPKVGLYLAFCGAIKDEIMDAADLAFELIKILQEDYPKLLSDRYKLEEIFEDTLENMDAIAMKRGFIMAGKKIDYERCARTVLDEFRSAQIGRITLEHPQG